MEILQHMNSPFTDKLLWIINREITLFPERQINWTKEIENMDTKTKDLIDSLGLTQETRNEIKLQNQSKIKKGEDMLENRTNTLIT